MDTLMSDAIKIANYVHHLYDSKVDPHTSTVFRLLCTRQHVRHQNLCNQPTCRDVPFWTRQMSD